MRFNQSNNEQVEMTRRFPDLPQKVLMRDSKIVNKIMKAWDKEQDTDKVLKTFLSEMCWLSDERYWEVMRSVWIICGSIENANIFRKLMSSKRGQKFYFSTPEESAALRKFPERFEVFRATDDENDGGLSWTISRDYAEHYKIAFSKEKVISMMVDKSQVFAYINRNQEEEIIIL